ncbi:MAG: Hint domain-containing protein, partial [Rhodobacteraceae bacterium]|nr:Hint domain-containing protein [Paracoccaceae bacterium]
QTLRWIGSRELNTTPKTAPIVFTKGALTDHNGIPLPQQDLTVSPQHRMQITNWRAEVLFAEPSVLIAAKHLVNGDTIYVSPTTTVEYFHILFDKHEIVFANGCPSERFHPGEQGFGKMPEETRNEIYTLFPELRTNIAAYGTLTQPALKAFEARALLGG